MAPTVFRDGKYRGTSDKPEVLALTPHALWILVDDRELMLDFKRFPWFKEATIQQACDVEYLHGQHLYWKQLDVDLHIESVEQPERYPLIAKSKTRRSK